MPDTFTSDSGEKFQAIESDRWRIEPLPDDDTFALSHNGRPGPTVILTAADLLELANLLAIGTDMLNGLPASESIMHVDFVRGHGLDPQKLFSTLGFAPPPGAIVSLPKLGRMKVDSVEWMYERHATTRIVVRVSPVTPPTMGASEPAS